MNFRVYETLPKYSEKEHLMLGTKEFNDIESKVLVICFATTLSSLNWKIRLDIL